MSIRSLMLMLAVGTAGLATAAADPVEKTTNTGGGFQCTNGVGVGCVGTIALLPITVNVKDVRALNANELTMSVAHRVPACRARCPRVASYR